MAVYVYCPRSSNGALELVRALGVKRLRKFDGLTFWSKKHKFTLNYGDTIICWGASVPEMDGIRVLNGLANPTDKYVEHNRFVETGVSTIRAYQRLPKLGSGTILLPRVSNHRGGSDLLYPPTFSDYYVVKEDFTKEYRIHSFAGRSIRAGVKVPREGFKPVPENEWKPEANLLHPWIRSFDGGWRIDYNNFQSTAPLRKLAHLAVKALELTFGAVDLAEKADGTIKVLEVNRSPGIEANTIQVYVRAINSWLEREKEKEENDNEKPIVGPAPLNDAEARERL